MSGDQKSPAPERGLDAAGAFRAVTEPLREPLEDWQVTDAEAALAGERLLALDDRLFSAVVAKMAAIEGGKYLRRLLTETEEERSEVPEAIRAFVVRLSRCASIPTARAVLLSLRSHALGRFLMALASAPKKDARRMIEAAGGPDVFGALAVIEALRAVIDDHRRAIRSLEGGLATLLAIFPPSVQTIRVAASLLAKRIYEWPVGPCERLLRAIERGAVMDHEAPGYVPDSRGLPPPFGGDDALTARLYEELRERYPRPFRPPAAE
jgi:hypothetical protein